MANLFYCVLNGHLTADATFKKLGEDKGVLNFTVAHNFPTSKKDENQKTIYEPQFYSCVKWVNSGDAPEALMNNLKKGSKTTLEIQKIEISTIENADKKYTNVNFIVSNIV